MEELHSYFKKAGADMVGYVDKSSYTFDESKSVIGEYFCGLPLDEDSESDQTDSRLETWAAQLKGNTFIGVKLKVHFVLPCNICSSRPCFFT